MEYFAIPQSLPAHDALNDAYFTALVAQKLDLKKGIMELRNERDGDAFLDTEIGNADVGEDGFVEIRELLCSQEIAALRCPICDGAITRERFLHCRGQRYDSLIHCEKDGVMLLRLKLSRNFNETWRAHVRVLPATEDIIAAYRERTKEPTAKKRPRRRHSRRSKASAGHDEAATAAERTTSV